jgi:hypothetical protein
VRSDGWSAASLPPSLKLWRTSARPTRSEPVERCLACEADGVATQSVCRVQYGRFTDCRAHRVCRCGALRGTRFTGQTRTEPRNDQSHLINHLPSMPYPSASQARQRSTGSDRVGLASEAALHGCRGFSPMTGFFWFPKTIAQLSDFLPGIGLYGARRFPSTAWRTNS